MQKDWEEIEIKNFLGISTQRTPKINECSECIGFDLRDTIGDLVGIDYPLATGYLSPPDFASQGFIKIADLGFTTHVFSQLDGVQKEVTFYFQRGTVGGYPHVAVGIYPFYNDATGHWVNDWRWLNRLVVTTIIGASTYLYTLASYPSFYVSAQKVIYNVTKNQWASIVAELGGGVFSLTVSGWAISDNVIVMDNYEPFGSSGAYYTAKSSIVTADLSFHRVLNELRVGYGSVINRLAIGIGYKKKYFQIDTVKSSSPPNNAITDIDQVILDPYNIISDSGTFGVVVKFGGSAVSGTTSTDFPSNKYFKLITTAILDDFNEFVVKDDFMVYDGSLPGVGPYKLYTLGGSLDIMPIICFATMNKRVTKIRFWLALGDGIDSVLESPRLIKEIDVSKSTPLGATEKLWTLDNTGHLILSDVATKTASGWFNADYAAYVQGESLNVALGYTPTTQYATSWDQALVAGGATYLLNPYVDRSWKNFIFNSPISGAGASQYDVISAENYQSLDTKDGNDIVGIEINSSMDFSVFRGTGFQQYDPVNQVPSQMINGNGATSRLGIVNSGGLLFFPAQKDIFINSGNQLVNITEKTIRDYYRTLTAAQKAAIIGGKDKDGSYRFITTALPAQPEYMYIKDKGWVKTGLDEMIYYGNRMDGTLLYMSIDGTLWQINEDANVYGDSTWISIPIDISLMGQELPSDARFIIGSVWIEYTSDVVVALSISYDGGSFVSIGNFPANVNTLTNVVTNSTSDNFTKSGHGLVSNDKVTLSNIVTTTGIVIETPYYVILDNSSTFRLSLTKSGPAVDLLTGNGNCTVRQTIPIVIKKELKIPPGRNAKYFQVKLVASRQLGDSKPRISAVGIRWKLFKTGLFR